VALAMIRIRPTKHRSGTYRLRLAIPAPLRATTLRLFGCRAELIENLGTKDPREAKQRAPAAEARLRSRLDAAEAAHRGENASLSDCRFVAWGANMKAEKSKAGLCR